MKKFGLLVFAGIIVTGINGVTKDPARSQAIQARAQEIQRRTWFPASSSDRFAPYATERPSLPAPVPRMRLIIRPQAEQPVTPEPGSPTASVTPLTTPEFLTPEQAPRPLVTPGAPRRLPPRVLFIDE